MPYEPLHVVDLDPPLQLATAGRAGRWFSAQGVMASDHRGGLVASAEVAADVDRYAHDPRPGRETQAIYQQLEEWLGHAGMNLDDLVRVDQYYPDTAAVSAYQTVRRRWFTGHVPPSTSIVVDGLLSPQCRVHLDTLGLVGGRNATPVVDPDAPVRKASGFAPALQADELVFLAGQLPNRPQEGLAPEVARHPELTWGFSDLTLQSGYVLDYILGLAASAGVSPEQVLKAQVYLKHLDDLPYLTAQWRERFGDRGPVLTVVSGKEFGLRTGQVEINLLGARDGVPVERAPAADDRPSFPGEPGSIRAGDLVVLPGLMAADGDGLVASAASAGAEPFARSAARAQASEIIDRVEAQLDRHGLGLAHLLRIVQFHTDLREFRAAAEVWAERLEGRPVPLSAVQVPGGLPVRRASLLAECWAVSD